MRKRIQIILLVFIVLAGVRLLLNYHERHAPVTTPNTTQSNSIRSADDYVVPTQLHSSDLKSAKEDLTGKTVCVKVGNYLNYFPCSGGHVDFKHPAGILPPLKKLQITDVIATAAPDAKSKEISPGVRIRAQQVLAVFKPAGETKIYAVSIGSSRGGNYTLFINDTFFFDDPRELYKHWPSEVWAAIDRHEALKGMSIRQVNFALGVGVNQSGTVGDIYKFDNNGHPVTVTFENNRATQVVPTS